MEQAAGEQPRLGVQLIGQGKDLLLLHGWGCNGTTMLGIAMALSDRRLCHLLEFPGFGSTPPPSEPWGVAEYMELVATYIRENCGGRADIVAHSFGGRVTLLLAATHPELVGRILITGGAGLKPRRGLDYYLKVGTYKTAKLLCRLLGLDVQKLSSRAGSAEYRALEGVMRATFVKVVNQDLRWTLPQIAASVLLIWGENDQEAPLWMGRVMEKELPDGGLVVFEGAGHFAFVDQGPRFAAIARNFFQ